MKNLITKLILLLCFSRIAIGQDLTIPSFTATSTSLSSGSYFYPSVQVSNTGSTLANSSYVGFYLSTDSVLSVSDVFLDYYSLSSISAGSSTTLSPSIYLPSTVVNGNYYLFSYADYTGTVFETNENNNGKKIKITVAAASVDLTVSNAYLTPSSTSTGSAVSLSCYINNIGNTSASYNYTGFYLSTDSVLSASDTYLGYYYGSSLSGGSSTSISSSVTIPSTVTNGSYYVLFVADYGSYVTESNENNNVKAASITITAPNYSLVPYSGTSSITTCATTIYDNGGPSSSYSSYSNGSLTINPGTSGKFVALDFTSFSVESCCDYISIYDGTSTSATLIGTYTSLPSATIYATNSSGALTVKFYSDGSYQYTGFAATVSCVSTVPKPDLTITSFTSTSTSVTSGNYFYPTLLEYNTGSASAGSNSVGYYLSSDSIYSIGDTFLTYSSVTSVSSGGYSSLSPSLYLSSTVTSGQYYIIAVADYTSTITESNETNNNKALAITVQAQNIDLKISSISATVTTVLPGNYISPTVYETNTGNVSASYHYIGYYISTDSIYSIGDTFLNYSYVSSLSNGSGTYLYPSLTIPTTVTSGQYYLIAVADYTTYVTESNENNNSKALRFTVTQPNVDLVVNSLTISTSSVATGNYFYPTALIKNNGTTGAGSHYVGFYLSSDSIYNIGDTFLDYYSVASVSGGTSSYVYPTLYMPTTVTSGQYYLIAVEDYSSNVSETNETNNNKALKLTVAPNTVDLTVSSLSSSSTTTILPGGYIYPTVSIRNTGNSASGYSYVGFYLSSDSVYSIGDTFLTYGSLSAITAGSSTDISPSLYLTTNTTAGNYYIIAVADYNSYITETNENNNARALKITVTQPNVDLKISSITLSSSSVSPGEYLTPNIYEFNSGTTTASTNYVACYLSADSVYSIGDTYLGSTYTYSVLGGGGQYLMPSLYFSSSIAYGQYYLIAVADYDYAVSETNENNNTKAVKINVSAPNVDLKITSITATLSTLSPGNYFYPTVVQSNAGTTAANGYIYLGYYLSTDSVYSIGDTFLSSSYTYTLAGGTSSTDSPSLYFSSSITSGQYYVIAVADYNNYFSELNENNNNKAFKVIVTSPFVDLQISSFSMLSNKVSAGYYCYPTVIEKNVGTSSSGYNYIGYYLSTDSVYSVSDTYLTSSYQYVYAGSSSTDNSSVYIPSGTANGQYYLIAVADYSNYITESVENNNARAYKISVVSPSVDLAISTVGIEPNSYIMKGDYTYLYVIETNTGSVSATSHYIGYYLSTDSIASTNDVLLTTSYLSSNTTGNNYVYPYFTIPSTVTDGQYYIVAVADNYGYVVETNENNNSRSVKVNVTSTYVIDLVVKTIGANKSSVLAGNTVTASYNLRNLGNTYAYGFYTGFYLSKDTVYSSSDVYLSSNYTSFQYVGVDTINYASNLLIPSTTTAGNYYIIAVADYSNYISESNENNNTKSVKIAVTTINGVSNETLSDAYSVYPNPTNGVVNFSNGFDGQVDIYNMQGDLVFTSQNVTNGIDLEILAAGMYHIKLKKGTDVVSVEKLVITK